MQALSDLLKEKEPKRKITVAVTVAERNLSKPVTVKTIHQTLSFYSDLLNPRFKAWYVTKIKSLGVERFRQLASIAKADGRNSKTYFSWLLKNSDDL
jgi:hypothetical protein